MHAVTSTTESPERTTTAPFACLAILPVSSVTIRPPRSISTVWCIIFLNLQASADRKRAPFETGVDRMDGPPRGAATTPQPRSDRVGTYSEALRVTQTSKLLPVNGLATDA